MQNIKIVCVCVYRAKTHWSRHGLLCWHGGDCICTSVCAFVTVKECNTVIHCCFARRGFFSLAKKKEKKKAQQTRKNSHKPPSGQKSNTHGQINAGNTDLRLHSICFTAFNALLYVPTWQQAASERVHGKDLELGKCTFRVARDSGSESVTGRTPRLVPRQQPRPTAAAKEAGLLGLMATK